MNNNVFELTPHQQGLYDNLPADILRENIDNLIISINAIRGLVLPQHTQDNMRISYNHLLHLPPETPIPNFDNVVDQAKQQSIREDTIDINSILNSGEPVLRRAHGGGVVGSLSVKILNILLPPNLVVQPNRVVGGKLRKTSNKKVSIRRRRSSKARKARKARTTRRR